MLSSVSRMCPTQYVLVSIELDGWVGGKWQLPVDRWVVYPYDATVSMTAASFQVHLITDTQSDWVLMHQRV